MSFTWWKKRDLDLRTRLPKPLRRTVLNLERLEDRAVPADIRNVNALLVDPANNPITGSVVGERVYIRAEWRTDDLVPADSYIVRISVDGVALDSATINGSAGTNVAIQRRLDGWYASPGNHIVNVTVDPGNTVTESDEGNNTFNFNYTPGLPVTLPAQFVFPLTGTPFQDWGFGNYVDVDPRAGQYRDFRGSTNGFDTHQGYDMGPGNFAGMDNGLPVIAAAGGVVTEVQDGNFDRETVAAGNPGNHIKISHGNGWETWYFHFAANTITVQVGETVAAGQVLGLVGSSGNSTGAHLHFWVFHNGMTVETFYAPNAYYFMPPPYAFDAPTQILDSGTTNLDSTQNNFQDYREHPSEVTLFPENNNVTWDLYGWFVWSNVHNTDAIAIKWYRPNGQLHRTDNIDPTMDFLSGIFHGVLDQGQWSQFIGDWNVAMEVNGVEIGRNTFTVRSGGGDPEMRLNDEDGNYIIDDRYTPIEYASAAVGGAPSQIVYTVVNHGDATLNLSNLFVSPGFALAGSFPATVAANDSETFIIELETLEAGDKFGYVTFTTDDTSQPEFNFYVKGTVTGTPPAQDPVLTLPGPAISAIVGTTPKVLDPLATVTDGNSTSFSTGSLTVAFDPSATGFDRLGIRNQGNGAGQIGVQGNTVLFGGTPIGTFAGGTGQTPLIVQLNIDATIPATQALLRNITYQKILVNGTQMPRRVFFTLVDDTGNVSNIPVKVVDPVDGTLPTISDIPNQTINEDGTTGAIPFTVGDVETPPFNLTLSATTSDPSLIPVANITFGGSGANRTVTAVPTANNFGTVVITVTVRDVGGLTSSDTFTITVRSVNDAPTFNMNVTTLTVLEDAGVQSRLNWTTAMSIGPANESPQSLTFLVTNDNTGMFVAQPTISSTGTLQFQAATNANGTAIVTVRLMDSGGTANGGIDTSVAQTFTINVTPVNDIPAFTKGSNPTVLENAPPQSIANWATNLSKGPPDESPQTLTFAIISNTNPALFSAQPAIDSTGRLTYAPAADTFGNATIQVRLMDSGGTANGGIDTTAPQTFLITVRALNIPPQVTINGIPAAPREGKPLNLSATIVDPDSTAWFYQWSVTASNGQVIPAGNNATYSFTANDDGDYTVNLIVTDNSSPARSDNETVVIAVANAKPKANPGGPYNVFLGQNIQLFGTGSEKPGVNDTLSFDWDLDGDGVFGETGVDAPRGDENVQNPIFRTNGMAPFVPANAVLRVMDEDGGVRTRATTVNALPAENLFDFNTATSPTKAGFTSVRGADLFGPTKGFGWLTTASEFDNNDTTNALVRDGHRGTDNTFQLRVIPGQEYDLIFWLRDKEDRDRIDIFAEGTLRANDVKVIDSDKISDFLPGGFNPNVKVRFTASSADGILDLRLRDDGGVNPLWVLNGLEVIAK